MHGLGQAHASHRSARNKRGKAAGKTPDIERMEPIHILGWIDGRDDFVRIDLLWQRQLHQDAVDLLVGIELGDQIDQLGFTGDGGQLAVESCMPASVTALDLLRT